MFQIQYKIYSNARTEIPKLFETNVNQVANPLSRTVDADIFFTGARYIMHEQFQLYDNFKTYLEGTMQSEHVLRTGIKSTPYQKSFKFINGTESRVVGMKKEKP